MKSSLENVQVDNLPSHPTGVRGLKCQRLRYHAQERESHPTGVRGLKCVAVARLVQVAKVAPHWGAWIEITHRSAVAGA